MRRISTIFLIFILSALGLGQPLQAAVADPSLGGVGVAASPSGEPRIDRLAAGASSTVFARTYYGGPYNSVNENGSWWYRNGYPYPGNQGGWGFSDDASTGDTHWAYCSDGEDAKGVCFTSGDPNSILLQQPNKIRKYCTWDGVGTFDKSQGSAGGGGVAYTCWNYGYGTVDDTCLRPNWCPLYWYKLVDSYTEVWQNGSDDVIRAGGTLGGANTVDAYRVFFSADNPTYYPYGPQSDVPLDQIYGGGWSLCWVGRYSDFRTPVNEIKSSCNQQYVIMAGSYADPHQRSLPVGEMELGGLAKVNQQLKFEPTNWLPEVSFDYQWLRDGNPIVGATSNSYSLTRDDYMKKVSLRVNASKPGYLDVTTESGEIVIGPGSLGLADSPMIKGASAIGAALSLDNGSWDSGVSFAYQWLRDGVAIPAATSSSYTLQASDYLKKISVAVTGSKEGYVSETKTSESVIPVQAKDRIASLRFTGSFKVGSKAFVSPVNRNSKFDYSYQWLRNGEEIAGASSRTYQLAAEDAGSTLSAKVCALYLRDVSHCVNQDAGSAVQLGVLKNVRASFSGLGKVGRLLSAAPSIFDNQASVSYQWLRNSEPIADATRNTYFVDQLDKGSSISLRVTVSKPGYETVVKTSISKLVN